MRGRRLRLALLLSALFALGTGPAAAEPAPGGQARVLAVLERALAPEQYCEVLFLRHLGWRFEVDPAVTALTVDAGRPGRHATLAAVHAAGGLRIRVPSGFDVRQARAAAPRLMALADSVPSRLAYRHKLVGPVDRATKRLTQMSEAGRHVFPEIFELFHSPTYRVRMPLTEWTERDRMFFAARSPALAMEAFFRLGSTAECYVGQLLALYAVQYELLGRDWFDRILTTEEMVVGRPNDVIKTPLMKLLVYEVPHDWRALILDKPNQRKDPILALAPHGPIAFTGLAGVVLNQDTSCFTQDNILIVSASQRAIDELVAGGGIEFFNRETAKLWDIANDGKDGLLDVAGLFQVGSLSEAAEKKVDEILKRPMYSEIKLYVHPDGLVPLAFTVKKFVERTESPVTLRINLNGLDAEFYARYRKAFVQGCLAQRRRAAGACEIAGG